MRDVKPFLVPVPEGLRRAGLQKLVVSTGRGRDIGRVFSPLLSNPRPGATVSVKWPQYSCCRVNLQKWFRMTDEPSASKSLQLDRRKFSLGMMLTPLGLAMNGVLSAQEKSGEPQTQHFPSDQPTPPKLKRWMIYEDEHFSEPLEFKSAAVTPRVVPFALGDVRLIEGSRFTQSRDWSRGYMLRIDVDRMLHTFRLNAGLPSNAKPLGGWEAPTEQYRGGWIGHYLSASSFLIASTGDPEFKARTEKLVTGLAECQAKLNRGGYLAAFPTEEFDKLSDGRGSKVPFYTLNLLMTGLIDMYLNTGNRQALDVVKGIAAWVDAWTARWSDDRMQAILNDEFGGMGESLYNLATITDDDRWGRVGDRFQKNIFLRPLLNRCDELEGLHANTHLAQAISAARRYEVTSDYRFREVCQFFWETITEARIYATGGTSTMERWVTHANHLAQELESSTENEECCCAYNMLRLTRHLYTWQPDIRYAEYYERTSSTTASVPSSRRPATPRTSSRLRPAPGRRSPPRKTPSGVATAPQSRNSRACSQASTSTMQTRSSSISSCRQN